MHWIVRSQKALRLVNIKKRLKRIDSEDKDILINWGYALCDAAKTLSGSPTRTSGIPISEFRNIKELSITIAGRVSYQLSERRNYVI